MNIQLKAKRQDGFTIIELVVVILLLGILAATALPRFMDVTDEAHDAVVERCCERFEYRCGTVPCNLGSYWPAN